VIGRLVITEVNMSELFLEVIDDATDENIMALLEYVAAYHEFLADAGVYESAYVGSCWR
jgi:hypothetical protein